MYKTLTQTLEDFFLKKILINLTFQQLKMTTHFHSLDDMLRWCLILSSLIHFHWIIFNERGNSYKQLQTWEDGVRVESDCASLSHCFSIQDTPQLFFINFRKKDTEYRCSQAWENIRCIINTLTVISILFRILLSGGKKGGGEGEQLLAMLKTVTSRHYFLFLQSSVTCKRMSFVGCILECIFVGFSPQGPILSIKSNGGIILDSVAAGNKPDRQLLRTKNPWELALREI